MSQYYLHDGNNQLGPFTLEELKMKDINQNTPVWKDGMQDWSKAGDLPELAAVLKSSPPAYKSIPPPLIPTEQPVINQKKKSFNIPLFILLIVLGIGGYYLWEKNKESSGNSSDYNSVDYNAGSERATTKEKSPEELKEDLAEKELENPSDYLDISNATFRRNLLGEIVIEGKIKNTATVAGFKDIVIEVAFLAPSGTVLDRQKFTRYEKLGPGYDVGFKFKANPNKEVNSVSARVFSASPIN